MVSAKKPAKRTVSVPLSVTEREIETELERPGRCLTKVCSDRKFMMIVLLIAICDALLVGTELTADVLGILSEKEEVCNTKSILQYLLDEHKGELDDYFQEHNVDEIFDEIENRDVARFKRDNEDRRSTNIVLESTTRLVRPPVEGIDDVDSATTSAFMSATLFEVADVFGSISAILLSIAFIMKLIQIATQGKDFFRSKLQILDTLVIIIALPVDYVFFPTLWSKTDLLGTVLPLLFAVTSRVIRVVINCLINLHAKDKELFAIEASKLKDSTRQYRCFKRHVRRLQDLARKYGASEGRILACVKLVKTKKKKQRETSTIKGIMSVNRLLFMAAPTVFPEPNQHAMEEREDQADWVHARAVSGKQPSGKHARFAPTEDWSKSLSSLASASTFSYESDEDDDAFAEDTTDYNNMKEDDLHSDYDYENDSSSAHDDDSSYVAMSKV